MEKLLKRKIDAHLVAWKNNPDRKPLIVKGLDKSERPAQSKGLLVRTAAVSF